MPTLLTIHITTRIVSMKFNTKIKYKLTILFILTGVIPILLLGGIVYYSYTEEIRNSAFNRLTSVREAKKQHIESYFEDIRKEIKFFSKNQIIINALNDFNHNFHLASNLEAYHRLGKQYIIAELRKYYKDKLFDIIDRYEPNKNHLQKYFPNNPKTQLLQYIYLLDKQTEFCDLTYCQTHAEYHPQIKDLLTKSGYYDIFLVNIEGDIVYTTTKEVDFGINLRKAPYNQTNISKAFQQAIEKEEIILKDFAFYTPSFLYPASFIAAPIYDRGTKIGTLIFQIPVDRINETMLISRNSALEGLDQSSESYLVGSDYKMRSDSRFMVEIQSEHKLRHHPAISQADTNLVEHMIFHRSTILFFEVKTDAINNALSGKSGTQVIKDYRNVRVLSSYTPIQVKGINWVITSEVDEGEAFHALYKFQKSFLITLFVVVIVIILVAIQTAYKISAPLLSLVRTMKKVIQGDLFQQVTVNTKDETAILANTFNKMITEIQQQQEEIQTQNEELLQQQEELQVQQSSIVKKNRDLEQKQQEVLTQNEELLQQQEELQAQRDFVEQQKEKLEQHNRRILASESVVKKAYNKMRINEQIVREKNEQITASINCALSIQQAILPADVEMKTYFKEHFVLYKPKDIVSGDFYWLHQYRDFLFFAVADCTGHGVPGAFMAILGHSILNEIIREEKIFKPATILNRLDEILKTSLRQHQNGDQNGMDISLCVYEEKLEKKTFTFAGAKLPLYVYRNGELSVFKGNRKLIGGTFKSKQKNFLNHEIEWHENMTFYLLSDGYQDQNNSKRKSLGKVQLQKILANIADYPFEIQKTRLENTLDEWQGSEPQRDDITIMGLKL